MVIAEDVDQVGADLADLRDFRKATRLLRHPGFQKARQLDHALRQQCDLRNSIGKRGDRAVQAGAAIELAGGNAVDDVIDVPAIDTVRALVAEQAVQLVERIVIRVAWRFADGQQCDFEPGIDVEFGQLLSDRLDAPLGVMIGNMEDDMAGLGRVDLLRVNVGYEDGAVRYQVVLDSDRFGQKIE